MPNTILSKVKTIVISAGHGLVDPGAVFGGYKEKDETYAIAQKVVANLKAANLKTEYLDRDAVVKNPTNGNDVLFQKIQHINKTYGESDWVIEIHRDSATGLGSEQANKQFGVYFYGGDANSQAVAEDMVKTFKDNGAFKSSWARPDTVSRHKRLGWIRDTKPVAHLIECGFMQGEHTDERINWYAEVATEAIYKAFTGQDYTNTPLPLPVTPPKEDLPQYPREEVSIEEKFPNLKDYPSAYQDAIRNNDIGWVVNSLLDRDTEIVSLKNQVQELKEKNSAKTQELAEKDSEIQELKTQKETLVGEKEKLQVQIDNLNKELIEKIKLVDKAQTVSTNEAVKNLETKSDIKKVYADKFQEIAGVDPEEAIAFIKDRLSKLASTRFLTMLAGSSIASQYISSDTNFSIGAIASMIVSYIASETVLKTKK